MKLFYRELGKGFPLVILHGLYGSSDNWMGIAKRLSTSHRIILPDQRNHGQSPHSSSHTYPDMANDLAELVDNLGIDNFHLLGHSMGGRTAMLYQSLFPYMVKSLVVADIAPWPYQPNDEVFRLSLAEHSSIIKGMLSLPLTSIKSRYEAEKMLTGSIPSQKLRQFLLKNLKRDTSGSYSWCLNLPVLESSLRELITGVNLECGKKSPTRVLFVKGENSNYLPENSEVRLTDYYPDCRLVTIRNATHWLHAEQPEVFTKSILEFLQKG
ncbi:MAG TPA: alpha/beta fold hydrolase [Tenuifilaceae bacterium]|nr:alpha/beta fold hydrolase [Tenuifilaceae bacterium]